MHPGDPKYLAECQHCLDVYTECHSLIETARRTGLPRSTVRNRLVRAHAENMVLGGSARPAEFEHAVVPDPEMTAEELIAHRIKQFERKDAHRKAIKLLGVKVKLDGPIGIWHFGDPHIDDDGTDIAAIKRHVEIIKSTPGLFAANVGDTTNNWTGRLAKLWEQQSTNRSQAWVLAEWFIRSVPWLYLIGGNHDGWSGDSDPLKWIKRGQAAPYTPSEVRLELQFRNGNTCRINARHDFSGHSQYNPAHGPMKATMFGVRDHIAVAGHKHVSAHGVLKNPDDGSVCHAFLVASYKTLDRFAMERGFRDQHISPGVLTIINADLPNTHPDFISHFWSLEYGVKVLNALRGK